jgi:hypothetical protein
MEVSAAVTHSVAESGAAVPVSPQRHERSITSPDTTQKELT